MAKFIFTWENLQYSVNEKRNSIWKPNRKKVILDGVSGSAFSGSLMAIMGVSGCGKTTLLTLLSGQRRGKGVLKINGRIITGKMLRSNSAFMQQKDYFLEGLTVYEHISFMAAMSLRKPPLERNLTINNLLKDFNLDKLKYTLIQYLSGGEKRKLSLASNLLLDPYILFCDEPTSGLDSFSAISIVKTLETVAASGKMVFLTVHQPSSQLFDLFDNIIFLSTNGKFVFQGSKENGRSFFESQGLLCPDSYNPADFYIQCIAINSEIDDNKVTQLIKAFNEDYLLKLDFSGNGYNGLLLKYRNDEKNFFYMLSWLSWRIFLTMKRRVKQYYITFLLIMLSALLIGISYSKTVLMGMGGVQSIQGALLLIVSELIFNQVHQIINIFPAEIEIFTQEKNLYASLPYFLSKIVSLVGIASVEMLDPFLNKEKYLIFVGLYIPFSVIHSLGFLMVYFLCLPFLHSFKLFFEMYLILLLSSLGGSALGLCLSALFPTVESVQLFIVPLEILVLILSGIWIRLDTLPKIFTIVKYLSPFYYSYESINIVYWLEVNEIDNCTKVVDVPCYKNGTEVLQSYDFVPSYTKVNNNFLFMLILIAVYCYLGYIGILRKRALYHI